MSMERNCSISTPSQLSEAEISQWKEMQRHSPQLHRAFFSPTFSLGCEVAGFDARVAVIRRGGLIEAIFPFQFHSQLHKWLGLAEPIGAHLPDATGIVARAGWRTSPKELMRLCGLGAVHIDCLADGQHEFGLKGYEEIPNYIVDLSDGYDRYIEELRSRNADLVRDTGRRFRRATRSLGSLVISNSQTVDAEGLERLVSQKRAQYRRTNVGDALNDARTIRLLKFLVSQNEEGCAVFHTTLEASGKVIAEHFGLRCFNALSYWLPVYNPEFQQYSPGRLILWELIREAPQNGITVIDFGEGEAQYKRQFSNKSISSQKAYWDAENTRSKLAMTYQSLCWRAQSAIQRIRVLPEAPAG